MAAQKFLSIVNGVKTLLQAITSSAGAADAGKMVALDDAGRLDNSMMPVGIGADTKAIVASENLSAGDFVNVYNDSGTPKVRKADATTAGKECNGFVLAAVTSGQNATVYFEGTNTQRTGLTIGTRYVLGTTAGGIVAKASAPSATGNVQQEVGVAISATEISFEPSEPIVIG
ncbi:MAG: hypothetical protein HGB01_10755 [Chlorobiaceae bacterium]|nr:hypothetical protein [Chlorobiaceae bacterium]